MNVEPTTGQAGEHLATAVASARASVPFTRLLFEHNGRRMAFHKTRIGSIALKTRTLRGGVEGRGEHRNSQPSTEMQLNVHVFRVCVRLNLAFSRVKHYPASHRGLTARIDQDVSHDICSFTWLSYRSVCSPDHTPSIIWFIALCAFLLGQFVLFNTGPVW